MFHHYTVAWKMYMKLTPCMKARGWEVKEGALIICNMCSWILFKIIGNVNGHINIWSTYLFTLFQPKCFGILHCYTAQWHCRLACSMACDLKCADLACMFFYCFPFDKSSLYFGNMLKEGLERTWRLVFCVRRHDTSVVTYHNGKQRHKVHPGRNRHWTDTLQKELQRGVHRLVHVLKLGSRLFRFAFAMSYITCGFRWSIKISRPLTWEGGRVPLAKTERARHLFQSRIEFPDNICFPFGR